MSIRTARTAGTVTSPRDATALRRGNGLGYDGHVSDHDLDRLAADYWDAYLRRHPTYATAIGDRRFDADLTDDSSAGRTTWRNALDDVEARLQRIGNAGDPVTRSALAEAVRADRAILDADLAGFTVDPMDGPQVDLLNIPSYQPVRTPDEADALVQRWRAMPGYLDTGSARLREGAAGGRIGVASLVAKAVQQIDELLARPDADWPLMAPAADAPGVADELLRVVRNEIRPAFERFRSVLADEIEPNARPDDRPGLVHLPGGDAAYRGVARAHTSLDLAPDEIHAIGQREIERIDAEFVELGGRLLRTGGLDATLRALRTDPALHFTTAEEIVAVAEASLARANAAIPEWFGRLPEAPCEVVRIPPHEEKHSTIAYYREPAADGSRPGQYYVNTYAPETRPRYEAETLAFHESVPGHHLQIAIAQELRELPAFRRFGGTTAFVEGWGLYTERLAEEMGLLSSETDRFGVLSFDAWRASRLVVDTGMHALGWTRQQAIEYLREHTALGLNNI